ncbi:hypothetical protein PLESTF_001031300 [Pleodorina starrii]|nr:hypothetical protein PLESTF_001031300 [Pleodorina starrii]
MAAGSISSSRLGLPVLHRAGVRQRVLRVHAAKKGSSPWSSGGPKRGGGKSDGSGSSGNSSGSSPAGGSGSGAGGAAGGKKVNGTDSGSAAPAGGSPWKDVPARQGLPSRPAKGGGGFGAAGALGGSRLASRVAQPPPETTFTDPISVTLLDELTPTEPAAEPKWGTFCSHLSGEWVGQYAAYTPWEGKPEPAWLDERGKYITVVYTRALEQRVKYGQQGQQERGQGQGQAGSEAGAAAAGGGGGGAAPLAAAAAAEGSHRQEEAEEEALEEADLLIRKIGRCTKLAALSDLQLRPPRGGAVAQGGAGGQAGPGEGQQQQQQQEEEEEEEDVDVEALSFNSDGVVIFDGGNYSAGPEYIGQQQIKLVNDEAILGPGEMEEEGAAAARARSGAAASTSAPRGGGGGGGSGDDEDEDEDEDGSTLLPTTTSVVEQCLVDWGSRSRMRIKMTLRIGQLENGEVDVQVLRILLFLEEWLGPATSERLSSPPGEVRALARPCTELPRPTPAQLQGSWNVFTVCATGIDEVDPLSGDERSVWVYSSTEEQQLWDTSTALPSGDEGASFWLPGGVVLSLRMVDNYVPVDLDSADPASQHAGRSGSGSSSNSNGNGNGNGKKGQRAYPRGLCVGMTWLWREGSVSAVEREYDGYGYLREVRLSQGVKGGWSGGRM